MKDENLDNVIADILLEDNSTIEPSLLDEANLTNNFSIDFTPSAIAEICQIRKTENLGQEVKLRVAVKSGGCSGLSYKLGFDKPLPNDICIKKNSIEVIIDKESMPYLNRMVIDYPEGLEARGFVFTNPNAKETCGCGSSFST